MISLPRAIPHLIQPEHDRSTLKPTPWGGTRLAAMKGGPPGGPPIGESLELSTLPEAPSRALGGTLSGLLGQPLHFVTKLLNTTRSLSIQVHPEDDAKGGRIGKEEAWIILDAEEDAHVLAGVVEGVTDDVLLAAMNHVIACPTDGEILIGLLQRISVARGMIILVPAGTVHSIGPGILLAEMQQPVDCTFRLFDYGSARPIHPEAAHAAWRIESSPLIWHPEEPLRTIEGRHLSICPRGPGDTLIPDDGSPRLLVSIGEGTRVSTQEKPQEHEQNHEPKNADTQMRHGDVLLHTAGDLRLQIPTAAMLVTGTTRSAHG